MNLGSSETIKLMVHIFIIAVPIGIVILAIFYFKGDYTVKRKSEEAIVKIIWVTMIVGLFSIFLILAFGDTVLFNALFNIKR